MFIHFIANGISLNILLVPIKVAKMFGKMQMWIKKTEFKNNLSIRFTKNFKEFNCIIWGTQPNILIKSKVKIF